MRNPALLHLCVGKHHASGEWEEEVFYLFESRRGLGVLVAAIFVVGTLLSGCGGKQAGGARPTAVKAMNVLRQDTPITHVYA